MKSVNLTSGSAVPSGVGVSPDRIVAAESAGQEHWAKRSQVFLHCVFVVSLILVAALLSYVVAQRVTLGAARALLVEAQPRILLSGLLVLMCSLALLVVALLAHKPGWVLAIVPIAILGAGLVTASVAPGVEGTKGSTYVPSQRGLGVTRYALPVLFGMGSDKVSPTERGRLKEALKIFVGCGMTDVQAVGFASSTPFKRPVEELGVACDSDCQNVRLANRRAFAVQSFVESELKVSVSRTMWGGAPEMQGARRLVDVKEGVIISDVEPLNRRVEVTWVAAGCR